MAECLKTINPASLCSVHVMDESLMDQKGRLATVVPTHHKCALYQCQFQTLDVYAVKLAYMTSGRQSGIAQLFATGRVNTTL